MSHEAPRKGLGGRTTLHQFANALFALQHCKSRTDRTGLIARLPICWARLSLEEQGPVFRSDFAADADWPPGAGRAPDV